MITCRAISTGGLGRFGNTCFTLASTIGIAVRNGQPYGFDRWRTVDNVLFSNAIDDIEDYLVNPLPRIPEGLQFADIPYHWEYKDYNIPTGDFNICSHLQDPRYFDHCMGLIRHVFRFKGEYAPVDAIGLHYRAGDYIDDHNAYHPRQSPEYYSKALELLPGDMKVIVFSDDIDAAMNFLPQDERFYFPRCDKHYIEDFVLMKQCKHFITANSSFSLMAAILGEHPDKKIVCPERWFGTQAGIWFSGYPKDAIIL